jgi:argininosuccinate lyase
MRVLRKGFRLPLDPDVTAFVASAKDDEALVEADIRGSLAHVKMLQAQRLVTPRQAGRIRRGLQKILVSYRSGAWKLDPQHEDVHMNVEKRLETLIGEDARHLHTARSRNDQVALDLRLLVMTQIERLVAGTERLQLALVDLAEGHSDVIMPGYTHLQRAQPVLFAHVLGSFIEALARDTSRLKDAERRLSISPLGAGALAGSSLPIDPKISARAVGFGEHFANSIDAVSDRDFIAEFLFAGSMIAVHLSQMAENLILWTTREFGFVRLPDNLTTGSSLMPQKKNPDPIEIVRGKTGQPIGELVNLLVTLKGLPAGYNRDLQETKPPVVRASDTLAAALNVMRIAFREVKINRDRMLHAASDEDLMATDVAEYLVRHGVPFRHAHEAVSGLVAYARDKGRDLSLLELADYKKFSVQFREDVFDLFDPAKSIRAKVSAGSTGPEQVARALRAARKRLARKS